MATVLGIFSLLPLVIVYYTGFSFLYGLSPAVFAIVSVVFVCFWISDVHRKLRSPGIVLNNFDSDNTRRQLAQTVLSICETANVKPPKIYFRDEAAPNAAVYGFNQHLWSMVVTSGLIESLGRNWQRIECPLAHEIGHIARGEVFFVTLTDFPAMLLGRLGSLVLIVPRFVKKLFRPAMMGGAMSMFLFRGGCMTTILTLFFVLIVLGFLFAMLMYAWYFVVGIILGVFFAVLPVTAFNRWRENQADIYAADRLNDPARVVLSLGKSLAHNSEEQQVAREVLSRCGIVFDQRHMINLLQLAKNGQLRLSMQEWWRTVIRNHPFIVDRIKGIVQAYPEAFRQ